MRDRKGGRAASPLARNILMGRDVKQQLKVLRLTCCTHIRQKSSFFFFFWAFAADDGWTVGLARSRLEDLYWELSPGSPPRRVVVLSQAYHAHVSVMGVKKERKMENPAIRERERISDVSLGMGGWFALTWTPVMVGGNACPRLFRLLSVCPRMGWVGRL